MIRLENNERITIIEMVYKDTGGTADGHEVYDLTLQNSINVYSGMHLAASRGKIGIKKDDITYSMDDVEKFIEAGRANFEPDMPYTETFARIYQDNGLEIEYDLAYYHEGE